MPGLSLEEYERAWGPALGSSTAEKAETCRFQDEDADLVVRRDESWLVKGLFPRVGVCFLAGPSGCGKSFWALDQASRISKGQEVLGRRSFKSGTVYLAAEGANGVRARLEGLRLRVGSWNSSIRFVSEPPNLVNEDEVRALLNALLRIKKEMEGRGTRLGLVIVDTLSASMPGADENSSKEMGPVLQALHRCAMSLGVCVLVIAHVGKDAERGIRGWSGQLANADGVITFLSPEEDGTRTGVVTKVKDGEAGERFAFGLEVVLLGKDADGDAITTCVIEERNAPIRRKPSAKSSAIGAQAEMILRAYGHLEDQLEEVPCSAVARPGTKGILLSALRQEVFRMGFHAETKPCHEEEPGAIRRWAEARKKSFQRTFLKLQDAGKIAHEGKFVWLR